MRIGYFTLVFLNVMGMQIFGQSTEETEVEGHHHGQEAHTDHHRHEIGVAGSAVYLIREEVFGSSIHLHYTFNIPETRFGVGAGYEVILTEHQHHNLGIAAIYHPIDGLNLNLTPGIAFEGGGEHNVVFALHIEASYEFQLGHWHIGPAFSYGVDPEDMHFGLGIHAGFGF